MHCARGSTHRNRYAIIYTIHDSQNTHNPQVKSEEKGVTCHLGQIPQRVLSIGLKDPMTTETDRLAAHFSKRYQSF